MCAIKQTTEERNTFEKSARLKIVLMPLHGHDKNNRMQLLTKRREKKEKPLHTVFIQRREREEKFLTQVERTSRERKIFFKMKLGGEKKLNKIINSKQKRTKRHRHCVVCVNTHHIMYLKGGNVKDIIYVNMCTKKYTYLFVYFILR